MTIEEIKELLTVFIQSGVAELEVQRGDNRLRLKRSSGIQQDVIVSQMPQQMMAAAPTAQISSPQPIHLPGPSGGGQPKPVVDENAELVKSPIVGTFYESASPGSPPFVRVGDLVDVGTVLCIIESMKLMNEIESEVAGTVAARLVENGRPVEYGEALFAIRPR